MRLYIRRWLVMLPLQVVLGELLSAQQVLAAEGLQDISTWADLAPGSRPPLFAKTNQAIGPMAGNSMRLLNGYTFSGGRRFCRAIAPAPALIRAHSGFVRTRDPIQVAPFLHHRWGMIWPSTLSCSGRYC